MPDFTADQRWYRTAFGPLAAGFWTALVPPARIEEEARFLAAALRAPAGGLLLDLPCGAGRQARALGRLGYPVEGVDGSAEMLAAASSEGEVAGVALRRGEMSALDAERRYDGAYCWGNSFGYLPDGESRDFLCRVARALRPGARFVLDAAAVAENVLASFQPRTEQERGGYRFTAERRWSLEEGAVHVRYTLERGAEREVFVARQYVYSAAQILRMAAEAGLTVDSLQGGIAGEPAGPGRPLVAVFRRG